MPPISRNLRFSGAAGSNSVMDDIILNLAPSNPSTAGRDRSLDRSLEIIKAGKGHAVGSGQVLR